MGFDSEDNFDTFRQNLMHKIYRNPAVFCTLCSVSSVQHYIIIDYRLFYLYLFIFFFF